MCRDFEVVNVRVPIVANVINRGTVGMRHGPLL
jgi:hypothetical protein